MTGSKFRDLADAAADRVLVAFGAGLRIVERAETLYYIIALLERCSISVMHGLGDHAIS
jgi:hypothetical protein